MNHKEKLEELYKLSSKIDDIKDIPPKYVNMIDSIAKKVFSQKGVYTVFITLAVHKILHPEQDIRYHQDSMENGFSGRSIDTKYITPTLKSFGLPSMAESGWLTRSLEQPFPYSLDYNGHIQDKEIKKSFLELVDYIQKYPEICENVLRLLLNKVTIVANASRVKIIPLSNPDKITIYNLIKALNTYFSYNYRIFGGSKLPVLAFYAIYKILVKELSRFINCELAPIGSHTASDRTSKTAGDILVMKDGKLFEAVEIKLDRPIDANLLRISEEKIIKHSPNRYYILSYIGIDMDNLPEIHNIINEIRLKHGCQVIINGIVPSLKYYFRMISDPKIFVEEFSQLVEDDSEIKKAHKEKWNEIIQNLF